MSCVVLMTLGAVQGDGGKPAARVDTYACTPLSLHLLGGFRLLADREPIELTQTAQRMVALVALSGRLSRSRIAGTLWPDLSDRRATGCLRTGVWRVNQAAAGLLTATRTAVELNPGVALDVRQYVTAAAASMRSGGSTPAMDAEALTRYEGELLPDWDEEWLLPDRERLRQLRLHLLEQEAGRLADAGHYGQALEVAFAALSADPRRESVYRRIIGIHLAEGNVSEARRAFAACRQILVGDLGVEPSEATCRMLGPVRQRRAAGAGHGWAAGSRAAVLGL